MTNANHDAPPVRAPADGDPFEMLDPEAAAAAAEPLVHKLRKGVRCGTERRGYETPRRASRERLAVDSSEGFIPLWAPNTTLRWRFQERSLRSFRNPEAAKAAIEQLFGEALGAWGDAMPVRFTKDDDVWDFEVVVSASDDCDASGCVLASAFFPDAGRHELWLYPKMFTESRAEQVETFVHELGHIFGLRHFFAQVSERRWPSEIFGEHVKFTIMNYGADSQLTVADKSDLKKLYRAAWSGQLTEINGTPIRLVRPFHDVAPPAPNDALLALAATQGVWPQLGATGGVVPQARAAAPAPHAAAPAPDFGSFDPAVTPSAETLRMLAQHMHAAGSTQVSSATTPFGFRGGPLDALHGGPAAARTSGKFMGEAKWWNAFYSRCELWIETDGGRFYFRGQGGGFPGAGAYSGDLYTGDVGRLIASTTTCQIVSALFYVNITFWDAASNNLGMFHGGGFGLGGGLLAGRWTR